MIFFIYLFLATIIFALSFLIWNSKEIFKAFHRTIYKFQYQHVDPSKVVEIRDGYHITENMLSRLNSTGQLEREMNILEREVKWRIIEIIWPCVKKWETGALSKEHLEHVISKHYFIKIIRQE